MLIRISLIVAIVAGLLAGALNIVKVRDKITTLITQRDDFHTQRDQVQSPARHHEKRSGQDER